jgi:catalase
MRPDPSPADALAIIERVSGSQPGYRRAHARGIGVKAFFTASRDAASLSIAEHFQGKTVPCVVRFSNASGNPCAPDRMGPKLGRVQGLAVRFNLPSGAAATWGAINIPVFPARTPGEFLDLTEAQAPKASGKPSMIKLIGHVIRHIHILASVKAIKALKPARSYAGETYHGIHTYYLIDAKGDRKPFRYRWAPAQSAPSLAIAEAAALPEQYLPDELRARLGKGPQAWDLIAIFPEADDRLDDASILWPAGRKEAVLGRLSLERIHEDQRAVEGMVFDPTGVVPGLGLSDDPILHYRSRVYSESFSRRAGETRAAPPPADMGQ